MVNLHRGGELGVLTGRARPESAEGEIDDQVHRPLRQVLSLGFGRTESMGLFAVDRPDDPLWCPFQTVVVEDRVEVLARVVVGRGLPEVPWKQAIAEWSPVE